MTSALGRKRERVTVICKHCIRVRGMTGTEQALQPKNEKQFIEEERKKTEQQVPTGPMETMMVTMIMKMRTNGM